MINPNDLTRAREWAEHMSGNYTASREERAAETIIQALPDSIVDGAEVRRLVEEMRYAAKYHIPVGESPAWIRGYDAASKGWADDLEALLPTPPRKPAMIKRGATAWHDELGEVTILSNKPNRGAGLAAVTDLVRVAADWDEGDDGSQVATVNASSLTAPDEGLVDSGTPETNNDSADDEEVDDYRVEPSLGVTHNDWWGASRPMTQADVVRAGGAPVEPTRSFSKGAYYDSEGNVTEPEEVPAGEAWLVQTRYHDEPVPAVKRTYGWVFVDRHGGAAFDDDDQIELVAPLVPKPEPRVLGTFKDYQDAAIGTIVRVDDPDTYFNAWKKTSANLWQSTAGYKQDNNEMSGTSRTTIWEPEEADQ